jgi:hypothetical protein
VQHAGRSLEDASSSPADATGGPFISNPTNHGSHGIVRCPRHGLVRIWSPRSVRAGLRLLWFAVMSEQPPGERFALIYASVILAIFAVGCVVIAVKNGVAP